MALVGVLGIDAVGDPALHINWIWQTARWALLLAPAVAWLLFRNSEGGPRPEAISRLSWWTRRKQPEPATRE